MQALPRSGGGLEAIDQAYAITPDALSVERAKLASWIGAAGIPTVGVWGAREMGGVRASSASFSSSPVSSTPQGQTVFVSSGSPAGYNVSFDGYGRPGNLFLLMEGVDCLVNVSEGGLYRTIGWSTDNYYSPVHFGWLKIPVNTTLPNVPVDVTVVSGSA